MKKLLSLGLVAAMAVSAMPMAYATNVYDQDYDGEMGTQVSYNAEDPDGDGVIDNQEEYFVIVPAEMAPGEEAEVLAGGTWASSRALRVSADESVKLTNSINNKDYKELDVTFPGITLVGDNTQAVDWTEFVSVAEMPDDALFGTWEGTFNYEVEMVDTISFTIEPYGTPELADRVFYATEGMTWAEWIESDFNPDDLVNYGGPVKFHLNDNNQVCYCHDSYWVTDPNSSDIIKGSDIIESCHYGMYVL